MVLDNGHIELAKQIMITIMCCNGAVNRFNPAKYPKKWVHKIAISAGNFFDKHPELLTDENVLEICDGDYDENQIKYGHLEGYKELDDTLNNYFNNL